MMLISCIGSIACLAGTSKRARGFKFFNCHGRPLLISILLNVMLLEFLDIYESFLDGVINGRWTVLINLWTGQHLKIVSSFDFKSFL